MNPEKLKDELAYKQALERLEKIFDAKPGTKEGEELEMLSALIEKYENEHYPI